MRKTALVYLESKYGKLCADNLKIIQIEMKKLDSIWRKNPEKFNEIIYNTGK